MRITPDPAITLYTFPSDDINGGMCVSGSYFMVTGSGSFKFQNYTVSFTVTCNDLVSMPYFMQCDLPGLYIMLAPLLTILYCLVMTIITIACCVHYRKQKKAAREKRRNAPIKSKPESTNPKPPAPEPERTAAPDNSALNFMKNKQIDLDAYVATKKEEEKPLVTEKPKPRISNNVPDLPPAPPPPVRPVQNTFYNQDDDEIEMSQTNEDQSENLVVGGQVNLEALGFQEEFF